MESVWTHHDPGLERGGEGAQVSPSLHVPDPQTNEVPIPPPMCTDLRIKLKPLNTRACKRGCRT